MVSRLTYTINKPVLLSFSSERGPGCRGMGFSFRSCSRRLMVIGAKGNRTSLDRRCSRVPVRVGRTTGTTKTRLLYRAALSGILTGVSGVSGSETVLETVRFFGRGRHMRETTGTIRRGSNRAMLGLLDRSKGSS